MTNHSTEVTMSSIEPAVAPTNTPEQLLNTITPPTRTPQTISGTVDEKNLTDEDIGTKSLKERLAKHHTALREKLQKLESESAHLQGPSGLEDLYRIQKSAKYLFQTIFTSRSIYQSQILQQKLNASDPNVKKYAVNKVTEQFRKSDNAEFSRQQGEALAGGPGATLFEISTRFLDLFRSKNLTKDNARQAEQQLNNSGPSPSN